MLFSSAIFPYTSQNITLKSVNNVDVIKDKERRSKVGG